VHLCRACPAGRQDSLVGIATGYGLGGPGIESLWGGDVSLTSRLALGPTQPPVKWVFPVGTWPGHGVDHTPPSGAEVTNE
jgi:hypothetical protein